MSERFIDPVEIMLDRPRKLVLDMWALMQAERELNRGRNERMSIFGVIDELFSKPSVEFLLILFWAALLRDDPDLTLEQAGHLTGDLRLLARKVREALDKIGSQQDEEAEEEKKTSPLNGSISGPLPESSSN